MIVQRYLMREVYLSTVLVLTALLMLFGFFDLVNELNDLGRGDYTLRKVLWFVTLSMPGHVYELFPVAVLIGALFALAQLGANLELTVLRVSGLSLRRIAVYLLFIGVPFVVLTFIFGEFIVPKVERHAQQYRLRATHSLVAQEFRSGLWVKDGFSFINVKEVLPDSTLIGVRIYEFDPQYALRAISFAHEGKYIKDNSWLLSKVDQTRFEGSSVNVVRLPQAYWNSVLSPDMLSVMMIVPEQMSAWNLYTYVQHLRENKQKTSRYEIALWNKLVYPFATLVMMLVALPFAFLQARSGGVSGKVFTGIMLGLSFHLLSRVFANLGVLHDWTPAVAAMTPTMLFLVAAAGALWWLEQR